MVGEVSAFSELELGIPCLGQLFDLSLVVNTADIVSGPSLGSPVACELVLSMLLNQGEALRVGPILFLDYLESLSTVISLL